MILFIYLIEEITVKQKPFHNFIENKLFLYNTKQINSHVAISATEHHLECTETKRVRMTFLQSGLHVFVSCVLIGFFFFFY